MRFGFRAKTFHSMRLEIDKVDEKLGTKIEFEIAFLQNGENSQSRVCGSLTLDRAVFTFLIIVCGNQFYEML